MRDPGWSVAPGLRLSSAWVILGGGISNWWRRILRPAAEKAHERI